MGHRRSKNKVNIMGNSTADFEFLGGNKNAVAFTLVSNEVWRNKKSGELQERSEYHRCIAFNKTAEYLVRSGRKGSLVDVEGRLQTRKWQSQNGEDRYTTEIVCTETQIIDGWRVNEAQSNQQGNDQPAPESINHSQPVPQAGSYPEMNMPESVCADEVPDFHN